MRRFHPLLVLLCLTSCASGTTSTGAMPSAMTSAMSSATSQQPTTRSPLGAQLPTPQSTVPAPTTTPRRVPPSTSPTAAAPTLAFVARALTRTNAYRSQVHCPPLHENAQLEHAALLHSQDMARHGYFDHNSPTGMTPWDRIHAAGYQFSAAAENIAAGYPTPEAVIDAFFNETPPNDGHRRNLLNCTLQDVGMGYFYQSGSPYGAYWTQDLASPL